MSMASWKAVSGGDANSQNLDPQFISSIDLHTIVPELHNTGISIPAVSTDYSGITRGNPSDLGAYEGPAAPNVITTSATAVTGIGATMNGTVNANTLSTTVTFEYGLTTSYGTTVNANPNIVSTSLVTAVSAAITGLLPNATTYHYRAKGVSISGTTNGNDMTFTTSIIPATVVTNFASAIGATTATVNGLVTANNAATAVTFQWGLTTAYGNTATATPTTVTGMTPTTAMASLTGLLINTLYHYRCVGINGAGTANGIDLNFTTNCVAPVVTISGPAAACSGSGGYVYTTQAGYSGYIWTVSSGGTITAGAGTNAITVLWNTAGAQNVNVNYNNTFGCSAPIPTVYSVTVNTTPVPTITGANTACESLAYLDYATEPGMTNYVWNIEPSIGTINNSGTNVATILWNAPGIQWVSVSYTNPNGCPSAAPTVYNVTVNPIPGTPGTVSGQTEVCVGASGVAYSVAAVPNASTYVWTLPPGGVIASGGGTNAITVNFNLYAVSGYVSVVAHNACSDGQSSPSLPVTLNTPLVAPGTINGAATVCQGSTGITYNVAAVTGATSYYWTVPTGVTIISGGSTNSITANYSLTAVSGIITVSGVNNCGTGVSSTKAITVNPIPATPVITQHGDTLTSSASTGNQWYLDGVIITGAIGQQHIAVYTGTYTVVVTTNGCSSAISNGILVLPVSVTDFELSHSFDVYPNPNQGQFNIKVISSSPVQLNIEIYNNLGALLWSQEKVNINGTYITTVSLAAVPNGVYMVALRNMKTNIVRKVVIMK